MGRPLPPTEDVTFLGPYPSRVRPALWEVSWSSLLSKAATGWAGLRPAGNKNAALPMLAAALLSAEPVTLQNVPEIDDVRVMLRLLAQLGVEVEQQRPRGATLGARSAASGARPGPVPPHAHLAAAGRAAAGPLRPGRPGPAGRRHDRAAAQRHPPAGPARARRGRSRSRDTSYRMRADRLRGAEIFLDEASVTGTEQAHARRRAPPRARPSSNAASRAARAGPRPFPERHGRADQRHRQQHADHPGREPAARRHLSRSCRTTWRWVASSAWPPITGSELLIRDAVPEHLHMTRLVFERLGVQRRGAGRGYLRAGRPGPADRLRTPTAPSSRSTTAPGPPSPAT